MEELSILEAFLEEIRSRHTRRAYRADLRHFFERQDEDTGQAQLQNIGKEDLRTYIQSLHDEGLSNSTRRRRLSALRRFFDWAGDQGLVDFNPASEVSVDTSRRAKKSEASSDPSPSVLSKSEVEALIRATTKSGEATTRDRGLLLTILYGALRRAEVTAMNVEHVRPIGRHWVIDLPPGDSWSSAYVKVPETVVEAIDAVRSRYDIDQGALWRSLSNRNRGGRMTPDAIYKVVRRTGRRAGLGTVSVDMVRQTGLYLALQAGATLQQVQLHSRLQSARTVERYADSNEQSGRLRQSPVEFVDLDISL